MKFNLFMDLDLLELKKLLQFSNIKRFKADEIIFEKDKVQAGLLFILDGRLDLYLENADGSRKSLDILYQGDFDGETSLFGDAQPRPYFARAMDNSSLLWINTIDFRRLQNSAAAILAKLELRIIIELSNDFRKKNGEFGSLKKELEALEAKT